MNSMNKRTAKWVGITLSAIALQGCVAIPPLIQVENKGGNDEIKQRLDAIDRRLERLEEKSEKK